MNKKNISYEEFVDKFKPKKTTDDCYTPPVIYDAVLRWARKYLPVGDRPVVRPFYPGGDYEHYDYPEDCVVIDNPPFSIFSKIVNFYVEHDIKFLLFAPAMSSIRDNCTFIGVGVQVTYENGAVVNTSFVTNMTPGLACMVEPAFYQELFEAEKTNRKEVKKQLRKLSFPDCALRASTLHTWAKAGIKYLLRRKDCRVVSQVSNDKRGEFGNSFLLSDKATAERLAAERLAAKRLAAERLAAEKLAAERLAAERLELSDKSKAIIAELNSSY